MTSQVLTAETSVISVDLMRAYDRSDAKPEGWSREHAQVALRRYERWLLLAQGHPGRPLSPTRDIDVMWHLHMLSPRAYWQDCMRLFGRILDHDGGFGRTDDEAVELQRIFGETAALWQDAYGEPYVESGEGSTKCWHDCKSRCWHACSTKQ
jgi:hypothetical protein